MLKETGTKLYSILFLLAVLVVIIFSIRSAAPPPVVKSDAADSLFSAQRAFEHIKEITKAPHSVGTAEHERVKNYIVSTCQQLGLHVETQDTIVVGTKTNSLVAITVHNIIAYIRGAHPGKAVVNVAHYDSQPNTPGAADDGIGVTAMLEAARALKSLPAMQNDIVFLFTDGEEEGLYGAKAFVEGDSLFKNVRVVMNWDFRGNSGITITYESSANNGWIMREYGRGVKYPYGNSMAFEISKRLPNYVDFYQFQKGGVSGFTSGMIDGFTSYHSMTDNAANLDQKSLQQVGDNILSMTKHLGNDELKNTKAGALSYFNIIGFWFVYYPSFLNFFFIIITTLFFLVLIYAGFRKQKIRLSKFLVSIIALPASMVATYFVSAFFLQKIIKHYPLYTHFDANNSYNSYWYFLAITMLAIIIFSSVYQFIVKSRTQLSAFAGILTISIVCMWAAYFFTPSASWLLFIPILFLLGNFCWLLLNENDKVKNGLLYHTIAFISVLPTILLIVPLTYFMFISFGLSNSVSFVSVLIVFIAALTYPVLGNVLKDFRWLLPLTCFAGLICFLLIAHFNSGYNASHPLQTNVSYKLNVSDSTAVWSGDLKTTDKFSRNFFPDKKKDTTNRNKNTFIHQAPILSFPPPLATIQKDTSFDDTREITLLCSSARNNASLMGIVIGDSSLLSVKNIEVNGQSFVKTGEPFLPSNQFIFYGAPKQGFIIKFLMKANTKLSINLFDRSIGLPLIKNLTEYPQDIIPGQGFISNTTQVERRFVL
ncbi:MAG: M20/M25/M40 family metallo-hydrolase [Ginsengibacter sp.]